MDSRIALHALTPPPTLFASAILHPAPAHCAAAPLHHPAESHQRKSHVSLRQSIRRHFPPPPPPPVLQSCHFRRVFKPHSLPELQRAILHARRERRRLRPVVLRTSVQLTPEVACFLCAGGVVVDMSRLNRLQLYKRRGVAVVQAGVQLRDLEEGLGDAVSQRVNVGGGGGVESVGGCFVRGVFGGGGVGEGLFGDVVTEVSFVDAFGRLRVEAADGVAWRAVKMSLGLFGVVYDVTMRVDAWRRLVRVGTGFVTMRGLVGGRVPVSVRRVVEERGGVELTWVPFNSFRGDAGGGWCVEEDVCWVRTLERVGAREDGVECDEDHDVVYRFLTVPQWLSVHAGELERAGYVEYRPEHAKVLLGVGFEETAWKLETRPYVQTVAHAVRWQENPEAFPVAEVGVGLPLRLGEEDDWDVVQEAWKVVMRKVEEYDMRKEYPLNVGMKTSFVKATDALLAANLAYPERTRRNACSAMVRIVTARNTEGWQEFARDVVAEWMKLPGARWQVSGDLAAVCSAEMNCGSMRESVGRFLEARRKAAVDDYGMFVDEGFASLLGLRKQVREFHSSPVSSTGSAMQTGGQLDEMDELLGVERLEQGCEELEACEGVEGDGDGSNGNHDDTPSALVQQSSIPHPPQCGTPQLFASPIPSRNSISDDTDGFDDDEGYDGDDDGSDVAVGYAGVIGVGRRGRGAMGLGRYGRSMRQSRQARRRQQGVGRVGRSVVDLLMVVGYVAAAVVIGLWVLEACAMASVGRST